MNKLKTLQYLLLLFFLYGCLGGKKWGIQTDAISKKELNASITSINVSSNQLTINGSGLANATAAKISGSGLNQSLDLVSVSDTQIIATTQSAFAILVGSTLNLVIDSADAQVVFPVTFTLQDGAVTASKLHNMGATAGQILKYNGTNWTPASQQEATTYLGVWNATTTIPDVTLTSPGDYYIVNVAGGTYSVGDWIISDGYNWSKLAYSKTSVTSFQGRKGIVTLQDGDYVSLRNTTTNKLTGSSLNDIADIDLSTAPTNGQVLKWDSTSSKWKAGADNSGSSGIALTDLSASSPLSYNSTTGVFTLPTANVLALPLTGLSSGSGSVAATDSILQAFGKLMSVPSDYISKSSGASVTTGTIAVSGTGMITVPTATGTTLSEVTNVTYVSNAIAANGVWDKGASSSINYTAGSVGIGTTTPSSIFEIIGGTAAVGTSGTNITMSAQNAGSGGAAGGGFVFNTGAGTANWPYGGVTFNIGSGVSAGTIDINRDTSSVYSSSGTSIPYALRIKSAWNFEDNPSMMAWTTRNSSAVLQSGYFGATSVAGAANYTPNLVWGQQTGSGAYSERMRMNGSGNLGINTTNPALKLHVRTAAGGGWSSSAQVRLEEDTGAGFDIWGGSNLYIRPISGGSTFTINGSGYVGIAGATPRTALDVNGAIASKPAVSVASTTTDFASNNIAYTTQNCQAYALWNMKDGATYTFAIQGTSAATACSFTAFSDSGSTALTVKMPPGHTTPTSGQQTLYSFLVAGTTVYVSWIPGY